MTPLITNPLTMFLTTTILLEGERRRGGCRGRRSTLRGEAQGDSLRGLIDYVDFQNRLMWNRHDGRVDGTFRWAEPTNRQVGTGWEFKQVFAG
jgi:hypothetical protein